jgi:hypothetical protein
MAPAAAFRMMPGRVPAAPAPTASYDAAVAQGDAGSPLYLITYDHGGLILWGMDHFAERLRDAISWIDRYPGFKIGLDNEAHVYDYIAAERPELLKELRGCLKSHAGRFGIGTCTYGQPLSQFINEESNVRQILYAIRAAREHLDSRPVVYFMSEHAMHSQIPQILNGFGFRGAIMRTHFMMYGYNPTFNQANGWWIGLDGSRIPAVPTYVGEGAEFGKTTVDNWILTRYPGPECSTPLEDFRHRFRQIRPLLASRADDSGLRREGLVKQYAGNPDYRWLLVDELFTVFPKPVAEMKTLPDDFTVRMPWGYCGNEIWDMSRRAEIAILTAERLAALELLLGGRDREEDLKEGWKNLLVGQHHDIQIVGLLPEARKFLAKSLAASGRVEDSSLQFFASRMKGEGFAQVTVFNPLSWQRSTWVEANVSLPRATAKALSVRQGGRELPSALLSAQRYSSGYIMEAKLAFKADLAPLGLASYSIAAAAEAPESRRFGIQYDPDALRINTPYLQASLDARGGILSLRDKGTGKELLAPGKRSAIFAGRIEGKDYESQGKWTLHGVGEESPWIVAREYGFIREIPYTFEIVFRSDTARLDCRVLFHLEGQRIGQLSNQPRDAVSAFVHEQKLRFKAYPAVSGQAVGVRDLPFAIVETGNPYVEGNYWSALTDHRMGLAYFNRGAMGSVREADGGFSIPLAHAMYYIWGTRMLRGDYSYEFALYPFLGGWKEADLHRKALEYSFPVPTASGNAGDGVLGDAVSLMETDLRNVILSALYSQDGKILVRMYEYQGLGGTALLKYNRGGARLRETDMLGDNEREVADPLSFQPWQIRTVRLDPAAGGRERRRR